MAIVIHINGIKKIKFFNPPFIEIKHEFIGLIPIN